MTKALHAQNVNVALSGVALVFKRAFTEAGVEAQGWHSGKADASPTRERLVEAYLRVKRRQEEAEALLAQRVTPSQQLQAGAAAAGVLRQAAFENLGLRGLIADASARKAIACAGRVGVGPKAKDGTPAAFASGFWPSGPPAGCALGRRLYVRNVFIDNNLLFLRICASVFNCAFMH